jgi:hypothetical protein
LQPHAQILAGHHPTAASEEGKGESAEQLQDRRQRLQRWGFVAFASAILAAVLTTSYKIVTELILAGQVMLGSFFLAINVAVCTGIVLLFYARVLSKAQSRRPSPQPTPVPQSQPTMKLGPELHPESVASVTEHTTELLEGSEPEPRPRITARKT